MSGQADKLSGLLSQHMNLVNQTRGQASTAQQSQGAAAPAEEAALAWDAEGAAAALGTEAAERAPIDIAMERSQNRSEPTP
jgi:hypothetical protein